MCDGWDEVKKYVDEHLSYYAGSPMEITKWAEGLNLPLSGETILFMDYFTSFTATDIARWSAKILLAMGQKIAILDRPGVTNGELLESDLNNWIDHAKHNIESLKAAGAKTVIVPNPHEYTYFVREYPKYLGPLPFNVVFITDYISELLRRSDIKFKKSLDIVVTYHDPCSLNKQCSVWTSPRELLSAIPGVKFVDEGNVSQWYYCCGNGLASFRKIHPDIAYRIGQSRLRRAADLDVGTLIVACPHCLDQFTDVKAKSRLPIEVKHILELVAGALDIT